MRLARLPLFRKELVEQGLESRTFFLRSAFAVTLFFFFGLWFVPLVAGKNLAPAALLGTGGDVFDSVVALLFSAIYLFLPALMAAVFPNDRSRGLLDLLSLTELTPTEVVVEKYLSRLMLMLTLLLASLPLFAVAYAFGGVATDKLWQAVVMIVVTAVQVGAFSIMISARSERVGKAVFHIYLFLALFYIGTGIPLLLVGAVAQDLVPGMCLIPPALYYAAVEQGDSIKMLVFSAVPLASAVVFLRLAGGFLKAGVQRPRKLMPYETGKSGLSHIYVRFGLGPQIHGLPKTRPVMWREAGRWTFFRPDHAVRNIFVIGGFACLATCSLPVCIGLAWVAAVVMIVLSASNLFVKERQNQTLDVLLTTPLRARELVKQKFNGLGRLMGAFFVVLTVLCLLKAVLWSNIRPDAPKVNPLGMDAVAYFTLCMASAAVVFPVLAYFGMWIGIDKKSRPEANLKAVLAVAFWMLLPPLIASSLTTFLGDPVLMWISLLSPGYILGVAELGFPRPIDVWAFIGLNALIQLQFLILFRWLCLRKAERRLERMEE